MNSTAIVIKNLERSLYQLAQVRPRDKTSGSELAAAKTEVRSALASVKAEPEGEPTPPPDPVPPPSPTPLFLDGFDTSPAPADYQDTPIWSNDGEYVTVSGGDAHAYVDKVRLWTHAIFSGNVEVSAPLRPVAWRSGVPTSWGGFKFYLRRDLDVTKSGFYTVEPFLYDGSIRIQKKERDGETYHVLAEKKMPQLPGGTTYDVRARIRGTNPVTIDLYRDGALLLTATDSGSVGGAPYATGHFGFRSDFFEYYLDEFRVEAL